MGKLSDRSNDKTLEAVKELISKIPSEDLEKAAGGVSNRTINILIAVGALAVTGVVAAVAVGGNSGSGSKIKSSVSGVLRSVSSSNGNSDTQEGGVCVDPEVTKEEVLKTYVQSALRKEMDERALKALAEEVLNGYRYVLDWTTYFERDPSQLNTYKLKKEFAMYNGKIYSKKFIKKAGITSVFGYNWKYRKKYGGERAGIPIDKLNIPDEVHCCTENTSKVTFT